jgi:hypothetical protein
MRHYPTPFVLALFKQEKMDWLWEEGVGAMWPTQPAVLEIGPRGVQFPTCEVDDVLGRTWRKAWKSPSTVLWRGGNVVRSSVEGNSVICKPTVAQVMALRPV